MDNRHVSIIVIGLVASLNAATYTAVLQNGLDGYSGCMDTHIDKARGIPLYQSATLTTSWN